MSDWSLAVSNSNTLLKQFPQATLRIEIQMNALHKKIATWSKETVSASEGSN